MLKQLAIIALSAVLTALTEMLRAKKSKDK